MIEKKEISFLWTLAFLLMLLASSYGLFSKPSGDFSIGLSDKILHFLMFLLLSYFLIKSNNYFKISFVFIILYASISELIQFFLIYREGDLVDLFFNYLGIGVIFTKNFFLT